MTFNVEDMRSQLVGGGARPTQFQVIFTNPVNGIADIKAPFMIRAASLPPSSLGTIEVPYFGRRIKMAGDRAYPAWRVTVINDEDFLVRNALEQWSNGINSAQGNIRTLGGSSPSLYKSTAEITQFGKDGTPLRTYKFSGIFPVNISEIGMDWDLRDRIEEFNVDFQYDYWEVSGGVTGNAGGI